MKGVAAIETGGLTKDFPSGLRGVKVRAVDDLSLHLEPGQIYGLLGPNGSGKSTTIKLLLGLLTPTAGFCRIFGVSSQRVEARRNVGYLPESPCFYRHLSGRELVELYGGLCGLKGRELGRQTECAIAQVGLSAAADRRIGTYSKGMLQRIGMAQAIVHDPQLVILDEPLAGVDPEWVGAIAGLIQQLKARKKTVVLVSHELAQVRVLCDQVAILNRGRLVFLGPVPEKDKTTESLTLDVSRLTAGQLFGLRAWLEARGVGARSMDRLHSDPLDALLSRAGAVAEEIHAP